MERRSECPISFALDHVGDSWSLLVVRDLAMKGRHTFSELLNGGEGIARNILADRLRRLEAFGIIEQTRDPSDGRRKIYRMTEKGWDLLPILLELIRWSARYDPDSPVSEGFLAELETGREGMITRFRRRGR